MTQNLSAEIISIGTEILLGEITDTNSVYMAKVMKDLGINVFYMVSVGDNQARIAQTIRHALARADIVITCGGLGPTVDDMTRQSVAEATDRELEFHQSLLDAIAKRFEQYQIRMTDNNRRQAYLPASAVVIENPVGTAPSFVVEVGEKCVISLPGVPREMKFLMQESVIPYLRTRYGITEHIILARVLKTAGIGESMLDERIGTALLEATNPTVGLAAHNGQIDVRITAKADTRAQAEQLIAPVEAQIRERAADFIFGADSDTLEAVFIQLLRAAGKSVHILEVGLGGVIEKRLQGNDSAIHFQTLSHPQALSEFFMMDTAASLADMARTCAEQIMTGGDVDLCICIVANPDVDENTDKVNGTVIVVKTRNALRQRQYGFGGKFAHAEQFVANWSLAVAWYLLKEMYNAPAVS